MSQRIIRRALLSVSDKAGLVEFAKVLASFGVELVSTGGTRKALADAGLKVLDISEITGFPEMLDGRVKTLHPRVHGGILHIRDNAEHQATIREHKIVPIDMVVCNLYPFEATIAKADSTHEETIETIDIGGPSMVRSASKNYHDVAIVTDAAQYPGLIEELQTNKGALTLATRERLAGAAFARTAAYDAAIAGYFAKKLGGDSWPARLTLSFQQKQKLRYGENPHQSAAFYTEVNVKHACVASAEVLHGKELSYNNILDLDSALNLVREFTDPAAVVVKHNNPCGAATADTLVEAFAHAYEGDPVSAFGGILGFNREVDEATAMQITEPNRFIECVIAPGYSKAAFEILTTRPKWKASVRLLSVGALTDSASRLIDYRRVDGGLLVQNRDGVSVAPPPIASLMVGLDFAHARVVSKRQPTDAEMTDLQFTWIVAKHVKSNAIVLGKHRMIVGVGAGQMSRIDSTHMAVRKANGREKGSVLASDAFFPFRDNVDLAAAAGITAIVQPGGSVKDQESIDACNDQGIAMIFTGVRHFRH